MSPPSSANQIPSRNSHPLTDGSSALSEDHYSDVAQVAKALSELGGAAVALDLALDLVLNDAVEQARLATGATAAAIALERDGEMVCRATTGQYAPELGMRVETASGLSGECLRTGQLQNCSDTENDPRVDAEACRQLGIRSVLLVPLIEGDRPFGIIEAFSSRPNAFGERDLNTLQALAARVIGSKRAAEQGSATPAAPLSEASVVEQPAAIEIPDPVSKESPTPEENVEQGGGLTTYSHDVATLDSSAQIEESRSGEIWTTVLVILVIATAISLGVLIGWRGALQGSATSAPTRDTVHAATAQASNAAPGPAASPSVPSTVDSEQTLPPVAADRSQSNANVLPQRKDANQGSTSAQPGGGLTVSDNGKIIYRLPGHPIPGDAGRADERAEMPGTRLIRRVEPSYPEEAKRNKIQGAVVLNVQVLGDGNIGHIEVAAGDPVLAEAAVHAVRQWRYQPYVVDGRPVQSQTRITIRFTLPSS